ncbi:MAG: replication initiation negative regulator SeqA [Gammaproteobacteria bacterium]|nr:replication initiation negative regulator SeqA [Gammaproteobacteria bacterium]MBU2057866.1 replication initiation negative regulator SeqA [Gammaproteobacteria bacterium]MBU2176699.1 replication initiation negative regulator SeqA [Gammaproteobacteria bacterium]MBU2247832.1 replication initiation negative regulator SeqA [Gammaproteobacteria bacterium]MBU2344677.1 replication initiation negative regulator SeqA [Gammaproteobacteria bacterium]
MKTIEIDDDLYQFIASQTQQIGESASDILRRLLIDSLTEAQAPAVPAAKKVAKAAVEVAPEAVVEKATVSTVSVEKKGSVFDFISPQDLSAEQSVVGRFLFILSALSRAHRGDFAQVLEIKGRNRLYFGQSEASLLEAGSSTNPKPIPNTDFWVITNSNTTRKKMMLTEVASKLGYSSVEVERIRDLL